MAVLLTQMFDANFQHEPGYLQCTDSRMDSSDDVQQEHQSKDDMTTI